MTYTARTATWPPPAALAAGAGLLIGALLATSAHAAFDASAVTDLNIRSGPGPQYPVVGVIEINESTSVEGCIEGSKWCQVSHQGRNGWVFSDYLVTSMAGPRTAVPELPKSVTVPTATFDPQATNATVGAVGGAVTGALIGGPVGAVVGGVAGAGVGAAVTPPTEVQTYVVENRVDPVYLDGEVVVGARVPQAVQLQPIPDYEYRYVYVNGQPVLIDPQSRAIVHVYR